MPCLLLRYRNLLDLLSFPTRRSSDLRRQLRVADADGEERTAPDEAATDERGVCPRSEEHTSELQSHSDLVCRLLLEKKNIPGHSYSVMTSELQFLKWSPINAYDLLAG